jgi:hypothetical protein
MLNIGDGTGREIVDYIYLVAQIEVPFGKVRADETGPPGNEDLQ